MQKARKTGQESVRKVRNKIKEREIRLLIDLQRSSVCIWCIVTPASMPARSTLECACLEQYATRRPHTVPSGPFPEKQNHRGDDRRSKDDIKILRL
jgi:hypothetical protein